jgi:hypothetical protein
MLGLPAAGRMAGWPGYRGLPGPSGPAARRRASGSIGTPAVRLDEDEWVALADGNDLGTRADQGGHELQGVVGTGRTPRGGRNLLGICLGAGLQTAVGRCWISELS